MWRTWLIVICLLLAGCKIELYTGLSEREANHMLAILLSNGIEASKVNKGEDGVTLEVSEDALARSIDVLQQNGYPKDKRESIGKVFAKSGIMSSPFEERIRFIYALGEEVSQTLTEIDGVITARVHVVLPEDAELGQKVKPSSTAVFIKHRAGVDLDFFTPQIRRLVSNSIEGVDYENVTVVLVEAERSNISPPQTRLDVIEFIPGIRVHKNDQSLLMQLGLAVVGLILILIIAVVASVIAFIRVRSEKNQALDQLTQNQTPEIAE